MLMFSKIKTKICYLLRADGSLIIFILIFMFFFYSSLLVSFVGDTAADVTGLFFFLNL